MDIHLQYLKNHYFTVLLHHNILKVLETNIQQRYSFMTRIWRNLRNVRGMDIPVTNRSQEFVPAWYKWENLQTVKSSQSWQDFYPVSLFPVAYHTFELSFCMCLHNICDFLDETQLKRILILHRKKKDREFPVSSRGCHYQTLPGRE